MENEIEETLETPEETETEQTENQEEVVEEEAVEEESVDDLKKRLKTLEAQKEHWRNKANKPAEATTKDTKVDSNLSNKDIIFLAKADIHEDDTDEVLDWAKLKGISVSEAYKHMKPILDVRTEERTTAQVTNTKSGARGASQTTGEDLLQKAERTGEVPTDPDKIRQMQEARLTRQRNKA